MIDEMEHSASGFYISTRLNGTSSHKWDELCQHDKSVEMGILMQQAEVPEHKDLICNPNYYQ